MIDLSGPRPRSTPLPRGLQPDQLVGMAYFDYDRDPRGVVIGYVPRDLPGLDLSDPRTIRYRNSAGGFTPGQDEFTDYLSHISHLRVARSPDGEHFTFDDVRIEAADPIEAYGVEDPRITQIDGLFHITYVAVSRLGITTARMSTTDFRTFERHGTMLQPDQKDVVLFPEKVNGRYLAFTRPMPGSFGRVLGLWLTESDDLTHWGGHRPVAEPRHGMWDEMRIGASLVPIRDRGRLARDLPRRRPRRTGTGWARCCSTAMTRQGACPDRHDRCSPPKNPTSTTGSCRTSCSRAGTSTSATAGSECSTARRTSTSARPTWRSTTCCRPSPPSDLCCDSSGA